METIESLKKLEENPLFQMSLGSKELFHSNFLAWIISDKKQKEFVIGFLNDLLELEEKITSIIEFPEREKMNIDLRFKVELNDNTQHLIIIENKVKSLPYKEQLEKYHNKIEKEREKNCKKKNGRLYEVNYYLLSLINPENSILLNEKDEKIWRRISYENIADSIHKNLDKLNSMPSDLIPIKSILKAYKEFAVQLHEMATRDLKINKNELFDYFNSETRKQYQRLRLHDLYLKLKYQQIASVIKSKLSEKYGHDIFFNPWEELRKNNKDLLETNNGVFIKEGFSNSDGRIDLRFIPYTFKIENTYGYYAFGLELQGNQLRYAIEFIGKFEGKIKEKALELIHKVADKLSKSHEWLELPENVEIDEKLFITPEIKGKPKKTSKYDTERKFCKFGDLFLYKYNQISPTTNVKSIIDLYVKIFDYLYNNKQYYIDVLNEAQQK